QPKAVSGFHYTIRKEKGKSKMAGRNNLTKAAPHNSARVDCEENFWQRIAWPSAIAPCICA
ncbi:MAG: hypothetical protein LUG17_05045, partial [Clostridiales bacterium]|nr:hypothetical protein [Clostridiales bacterium]